MQKAPRVEVENLTRHYICNNNKTQMVTLQARQQKLSQKYSSSEAYFHTKTIDEFIRDKRSHRTTHFQDIEYLVDEEEYMKRFYQREEFRNKMFTFKEYYFYHQDCPRIFMQGVEIIYAKWQDRKRNVVYKKLKHLFNQGTSNGTVTESQEEVQGVTHFLFELSEYNPFSKKYYLRTQIKKEKDVFKAGKNMLQTRDQISYLKHDLSNMLKQMNELSVISTLDSTRVEPKAKIYHRKTQTQTREGGSYEHSNSNSNSGIKMNFKKKVNVMIREEKSKYYPMYPMLSAEKAINQRQIQSITNNNRANSPKLNPVQNKQSSHERLKANSIFAFTSLGQLGQENHKTRANSKREGFKLNLELKSEQNKKLATSKEQEQKMPLKSNEGSEKKRTLTIRCASIGKLKPTKLEGIQVRHHQISLTKLKTKPDEFCDRKLTGVVKNIDSKLPSYKSEHINIKKPFVKLKTSEPIPNLGNKKKLQIKL